ncbi:MAG: DUF192 domain-containing protein [Acidobacteriota bacterium]
MPVKICKEQHTNMKTIRIVVLILALFLPQKFTKIFLPNGNSIIAEIASTEEERTKGLMFRKKLNQNHGMIFIFEREGRYSFWMKNTLIPLDMIFINSKKIIVDIIENVPPCFIEPCETYVPNEDCQYVLEVNSGKAKKEGLKIGDKLLFNINR